jgi:hypothetical protein
MPSLDLGSEPKARSTAAEIENWTWHVWVPAQILAHGIPVSETEDPSDVMCID